MQKHEDRKKVERPDLDWGLRHEGCRAPRHIFRHPGIQAPGRQILKSPGPQAPRHPRRCKRKVTGTGFLIFFLFLPRSLLLTSPVYPMAPCVHDRLL